MQITGRTAVLAILGHPVAQVRAPEAFNHLFARHGVDAVMVPMGVAPAGLAAFVDGALRHGTLAGAALTVPHKQGALPLLERLDAQASLAGGVNAVRRGVDGRLEGALFDGLGFVRGLRRAGAPSTGARVLVVGAGGAGAAIAAALLPAQASAIALFDAQPGRAAALAGRLADAARGTALELPPVADAAGFDLVVNATPLGLKDDDPLPFDPARVQRDATVVDILMKPAPTPLLRACAARGIAAHDGHEMLLQQMPDYLSFFGFDSIAGALRDDDRELRALITPR